MRGGKEQSEAEAAMWCHAPSHEMSEEAQAQKEDMVASNVLEYT